MFCQMSGNSAQIVTSHNNSLMKYDRSLQFGDLDKLGEQENQMFQNN